MKYKVKYVISEKAAVLAGRSEWGPQEVEVDPAEVPEDLRAELYERSCNFPRGGCGIGSPYQGVRSRRCP